MRRVDLIEKAKTAGLAVTEGNGRIIIERVGRGACGIILWENGTITRSDVDSSLASNMTVTQSAKVLQIG